MAVQIAIPSTSLVVGSDPVPFITPTLPNGVQRYRLSVTPSVWPLNGSVLQLTVEESQDNGANFVFSAGVTFAAVNGGLGLDKSGLPITTALWTFTPVFVGTTVKLRLSLHIIQSCTVSASVETV